MQIPIEYPHKPFFCPWFVFNCNFQLIYMPLDPFKMTKKIFDSAIVGFFYLKCTPHRQCFFQTIFLTQIILESCEPQKLKVSHQRMDISVSLALVDSFLHHMTQFRYSFSPLDIRFWSLGCLMTINTNTLYLHQQLLLWAYVFLLNSAYHVYCIYWIRTNRPTNQTTKLGRFDACQDFLLVPTNLEKLLLLLLKRK